MEEVQEKLAREMKGRACLTVMEGNSGYKVGGFAWGALVPVDELPRRSVEAHSFEDEGSEELLRKRINTYVKGNEVFTFDEIAVLPEFRGGLSPIRFLTRPILEMAVENGVIEGISWTSWDAKITPIVYYMGLSTVVAEVEGISFLYIPDVVPLCKITQSVKADTAKKFLALTTKLTGLHKKMQRFRRKPDGKNA